MQITRLQLRRQAMEPNNASPSVDWAVWLAQTPWHTSTLFKQDGTSWVRAVPAPPNCGVAEVIIKCRVDRGLRAAIKRFCRSSRGDRQWRGAHWLIGHGLLTAKPRALLRATIDGQPCELLILERLQGKSVLEHLASTELTIKEQHHVARELGRLIAALNRLGKFNRDGKPSNLIVVRDSQDQLRIATIDTVAIRSDYGSLLAATEMLASLYIEPVGCGVPPRLALRARVIRALISEFERVATKPSSRTRANVRRSIRLAWRDADALARRHGDPAPKINPLASSRPAGNQT